MFLKNRNISSKIKRSKVTDYAALRRSLNKDFTISDVGVGCGLKDDTDTHCWKIWMILIKIR